MPEGASDDAASVDDAVVADTTPDVDPAASQPSDITDEAADVALARLGLQLCHQEAAE